MTYLEKLDVVRALFEREDFVKDAEKRFAQQFPDVDREVLGKLVFHLYIDGAEALVDMLWHLEMLLRGKHDKYNHYRYAHHVLYHLYNAQLAEALLPVNSKDLMEEMKDAMEALDEDPPDVEFAARVLKRLERFVTASAFPPDIDDCPE